MLRYHWILALVFLCTTCAANDPDYGSGRITLSPQVKASFEEYKARDAPLYFVVTESGVSSYYLYCEGGFNCVESAARLQTLDRCRRLNPDEDCKIYAIGRSVVWRDADAPRPGPQLSAGDRLIRECLEGGTAAARIDKCSQAIASPELAQNQKRGAFYVRARAYEQVGKLPEAEQDYRAVLSIDPDHPIAKARLEDLRGPAPRPSPTRPSSA
jgi:tetratricopeptide (TPR) repeat protein